MNCFALLFCRRLAFRFIRFRFGLLLALMAVLAAVAGAQPPSASIDRRALVRRHNVVLTAADTLASLSVGNGRFAFTADVTGLQTFPEEYARGIPLGTQAEWGWHSFPNTAGYTIDEVAVEYPTCNDRTIPVAVQHETGRAAAAAHWLRANPHRLHLGIVGLTLLRADGTEAELTDIREVRQELDLWTGRLVSTFAVEGTPVRVELVAHPDRDLIAFMIRSDLIAAGRLRIKWRFPYGSDQHVGSGADWSQPERHTSRVAALTANGARIERHLDTTAYQVGLSWWGEATLRQAAPHHFELVPGGASDELAVSVAFGRSVGSELPDFQTTLGRSIAGWTRFWQSGGAIDFSGSTDPRAAELERRVVLSQYLTRTQCAGNYPPQETGLTFNSWYGKFHLEMHWWHGVHFALWNRLELLEPSLAWYRQILPEARRTAEWQGFPGVRWPKMTAPPGISSPSSVGEFLIWQQPHPIYFAELVHRQRPGRATLEQYREVVFQTAEFMAAFAQYDSTDGHYHLCHPLIPAQEIFPAAETDDPPFELAYWYYALDLAQQWRERLGLPRNAQWQAVIDGLAPLPQAGGRYLPAARAWDAYTNDDNRHDHPIVTGILGMLPPTPKVDPAVLAGTLETILERWDWPSTWGWDYPLLAMCAARLGRPDLAVDALLMDVQKNTYLPNGHNYQDERLRSYLPGNGGLLTAVAMMAAGWDGGPDRPAPGFPKNGTWSVRYEGLRPMP
jgi:hypothetical protein